MENSIEKKCGEGGKDGGRGKGRGGQPERSSEFPFTSVDKTAEKPLLRARPMLAAVFYWERRERAERKD